MLNAGDSVYSGRIDRIIKENNTYNIYDYKTFPVREKEVPHYLKGYSFQLSIYKKAVMELFETFPRIDYRSKCMIKSTFS